MGRNEESVVSWKPGVSRIWECCATSDAAGKSNRATRTEHWISHSGGYRGSLTGAVSLERLG